MLELEVVGIVRDFVERGGTVMLAIALVTAIMWGLIYERFWYFRVLHKQESARVLKLWNTRTDRTSWQATQIRHEPWWFRRWPGGRILNCPARFGILGPH